MKHRTFKNETFDFRIHLVWPCSPEQFRNYIRKQGELGYEGPGSFTAICHWCQGNITLGFKRWKGSTTDLASLTHETFHATFHALKECDISLSNETEEVFAYLQSSLFERCLKLLK